MVRLWCFLAAIAILEASPDSCTRKDRQTAPKFGLYTETLLPSDVQVTVHLDATQSKTFIYASQIGHSGALSATLIPCQTPIEWVLQPPSNRSQPVVYTSGMDTIHVTDVEKGLYFLHMKAVSNATLVHIYMSSEVGGPQTLQQRNSARLRVVKRQKRKRLTVKWNPSLVDPQCTDYCLVVSSTRHYPSLCSARLLHPTGIVCVGRRTHYTLSNTIPGAKYHFDLFATNNQSNFTYPYGTVIFTNNQNNIKPTSLKDGKATFANLKKLDGKAVFRYKVGNKRGIATALNLFILPCGGVVDVEITLRNQPVIVPQRVEGFRRIQIDNPVVGGRYYIKIFGTNREEMKRSTGVEIYATTKPRKIPLPNMPKELKIQEYSSMTTCQSVTVGWMVAPSTQRKVTYCVIAKEGIIHEMEEHRMPNQCGLESRLRKAADYTVKYCRDEKYDKERVVLQEISKLKPGRSYIIQVTAKKPRGKTLSYDLLQVVTKPSCKHL